LRDERNTEQRYTMADLKCPRCHLSIRIRAPYLLMRNCPRCLARAGLPTPMYLSPPPGIAVPPETPVVTSLPNSREQPPAGSLELGNDAVA